MALTYKHWNDEEPVEAYRSRCEAYRETLAAMDFRGVPDLPKWFGNDVFNDGKFERFDFDARGKLCIEMECWAIMNEVLDDREGQGPFRGDRSHRCEDFRFICEFSMVVHFAYERMLPVFRGPEANAVPRIVCWPSHDDYQRGEIQESELVRELRAYYGIRLFHLAISTGNDGNIDIVFGHVKVRKSNSVPFSDYLGGKSPRLKCFYRWRPGIPDAHRPD